MIRSRFVSQVFLPLFRQKQLPFSPSQYGDLVRGASASIPRRSFSSALAGHDERDPKATVDLSNPTEVRLFRVFHPMEDTGVNHGTFSRTPGQSTCWDEISNEAELQHDPHMILNLSPNIRPQHLVRLHSFRNMPNFERWSDHSWRRRLIRKHRSIIGEA